MSPTASRVLALAVIGGGLILAVVLLVLPVHATFGDDPVLRLQGFDRQRSFLPTDVNCGVATTNLPEPSGIRPLYDVARDDACHRNGVRRFWGAVAAVSVGLAAGFTGLTVSRQEIRA